MRRFRLTFAVAVALLAVLVVAGAAVSLGQGPRVSDVAVDPQAAVESSGTRVILTANQALSGVSPDDVEVSPAVPFTVDASGREIGVRFTTPLDDDTEYRITVPGVHAVGGGPSATLEAGFRTPPASVLLLERSSGDDVIYRTGLGDGAERTEVFAAPEIDDFRSVPGTIVVSTREPDGSARLIRMNDDGGDPQEFALPGTGTIRGLQISERGGRIGYTYTDLPERLGDAPEREAQLFTATLRSPGDEPRPVEVAGEVPSVDNWQFVPDASAVLLVDFSGELVLTDPGSDADPGVLGAALTIDAVARGTYTAIVERLDGMVWIDLATGDEEPIVEPDGDQGLLGSVLPMPTVTRDTEGVDTVRQYTLLGEDGIPSAQRVLHVDAAGQADEVLTVDMPEALLQTCLSPSGRYVAATVAADLATNPYDTMELPMPEDVVTRVYAVDSGEHVVSLAGFDISWCHAGPS